LGQLMPPSIHEDFITLKAHDPSGRRVCEGWGSGFRDGVDVGSEELRRSTRHEEYP
jgi:hypothetical protein